MRRERTYAVRDGAASYGTPVGILLIDVDEPFIPGDVGNASTFNFPVTYEQVSGCTIDRLITRGDLGLRADVIEAAEILKRRGVRLITSNCGFMLRFQRDVREAVELPTLLSSLCQLPLISSLLPSDRAVGVIAASGASLSDDLIRASGVDSARRIVVAGLEDSPEFRSSMLEERGTLDPHALCAETVDAAAELCNHNPDVGAILLECAVLPPYARAVHEATGRPVFDFVTMLDYACSALRPRTFTGWY